MYDASRDKITKYFEDGRLFYDLQFVEQSESSALGDHLCEADRYKAFYHFISTDNFVLKYDILGPEKDYTIRTEFIRDKKDEYQDDTDL